MSLMSEGSGPPCVHLPNADLDTQAEDVLVPGAAMDDDEHMFLTDAPSSTVAFGSTDGDLDIEMAPSSPEVDRQAADPSQRSLRMDVDAWSGGSTPVSACTPTQRDTPTTQSSTPASSHPPPVAAPLALPPAPPYLNLTQVANAVTPNLPPRSLPPRPLPNHLPPPLLGMSVSVIPTELLCVLAAWTPSSEESPVCAIV